VRVCVCVCVCACVFSRVCPGSCLISASLRAASHGLSPSLSPSSSPFLISLRVNHSARWRGREAMMEYICVSKCHHPCHPGKQIAPLLRLPCHCRSASTYTAASSSSSSSSSLTSRSWFVPSPGIFTVWYSRGSCCHRLLACLPPSLPPSLPGWLAET